MKSEFKITEEFVSIVDTKDHVIGEAPRFGIHETSLLHRASHIFIFTSQGKLWVQKRADSCDTFPGFFCSSAAGHVKTGESYEEAAEREVEEELGLKNIKLKRLYILQASPETVNEFVGFFVGKSDEKPVMNEESTELLLLSMREVDNLMKSKEIVPIFRKLFEWYKINELQVI